MNQLQPIDGNYFLSSYFVLTTALAIIVAGIGCLLETPLEGIERAALALWQRVRRAL